MGTRPLPYIATVLGLAALYFGMAKLGLSMASAVAQQVTPVWPPSGVSLAALLLLGWRIWPGITLGALAANLTADEPFGTACGIAAGNTLEAVVGAWLLRTAGFDRSLERLKDVLALAVLAAGASTMVSATIGVANLCLGGVHPWSLFGPLWWLWWLGDATGILIITPAILAWSTPPRGFWGPRRIIEAS